MPCMHVSIRDRKRDAQESPLYNACVARAVKPAEVKTNAKARAAMDTEWQRLRKVPRRDGKLGVWDEDAVQEWSSMLYSMTRTFAPVSGNVDNRGTCPKNLKRLS